MGLYVEVDPISSGLFILPDDELYASDRIIHLNPTPLKPRNNSLPVNYARPFDPDSDNLKPIDVGVVVKRSNSLSPYLITSEGPGRKLSRRKTPPKITESLEDLSRSISRSTGSVYSSDSRVHSPIITPPTPIFNSEVYILPVDPPLAASVAPPRPPPRSSRRPPPPLLARKSMSMDNLTPTSVSMDNLSPGPSSSRNTLQFPTRPQTSPSSSSTLTPRRQSPTNSSSSTSTPLTPLTPTAPSRTIHLHRPSRSSSSSNPITCSSGSASTCGTWSLADEVELTSSPTSKRGRESRKAKKLRKIAEEERFDVDTPPSVRELFEASLVEVIGEDGKRVKFGDLIKHRKTIVVFIRHWFCPLCAQYMNSIIAEVSQDALYQADVELIIIGNGSGKMLPAYKNKGFKCPFKMYTDPSLLLYRALGLTRKTGDAGPDSEKGDYLIQTTLESTIQTLKRATVMPLRNPGHFTQLGGEFIFSGPLNLEWTHRMTNTRDHAPIRDVCEMAGVRLEFIHYEPGVSPPPVHRRSWLGEVGEEGREGEGERGGGGERREGWMEERDEEVERIKAVKAQRRAGRFGSVGSDQVRIVGRDEGVEGEGSLEHEFGRLDL